MFLCQLEQEQAPRAIALASCTPEQRCNVEWGFQPLKPGKFTAVLPLAESKKSDASPEPLVHSLKPASVKPLTAPLSRSNHN